MTVEEGKTHLSALKSQENATLPTYPAHLTHNLQRWQQENGHNKGNPMTNKTEGEDFKRPSARGSNVSVLTRKW